ncbi:transcriptional regulator NanR [compost metagenome]
MSETNKAFHIAIAEAGKNPYFINYYEKLLGEGQRLAHLHFDYIISAASTTTRLGRDHDEIIEAIAARNPDEAEQAAHEHTMLFQRRFLAYMQQNLTQAVSVK